MGIPSSSKYCASDDECSYCIEVYNLLSEDHDGIKGDYQGVQWSEIIVELLAWTSTIKSLGAMDTPLC